MTSSRWVKARTTAPISASTRGNATWIVGCLVPCQTPLGSVIHACQCERRFGAGQKMVERPDVA
ncbi:MAG TPA: hypothetical protein VJV79_26645, partial [Polyangiaceae bacterium]|nr:hypothetical protein [Polyangiaceae bacterium]